jgi:hypothetical protein
LEPEKSRAARAGLLHARKPHRAHRSFKQSLKNGRLYHKAGPRHRAFSDRQVAKGRRPKPTLPLLAIRSHMKRAVIAVMLLVLTGCGDSVDKSGGWQILWSYDMPPKATMDGSSSYFDFPTGTNCPRKLSGRPLRHEAL